MFFSVSMSIFDRCYHLVPCLADPAKRSSLGLKAALVALHIVYAGILFLFDADLIEKTKQEPWYTGLYLFLFVATLVQYFVTSFSSPGYVLDAMRDLNENDSIFRRASMLSNKDSLLQAKMEAWLLLWREASQEEIFQEVMSHLGQNWFWICTPMEHLLVRRLCSGKAWDIALKGKLKKGGTLMCSYCNVEQPPRAKHCHDCDKCVLQFDHHCVWLGTCIGQGNHCRFWWYIFEETALCLWTAILYITYLKANISSAWWKDVIMILLLVTLSIALIFLLLLLIFHSYLILTNQTTYELVRRRRIPYLRGIPERVYPFSKGVGRNLYGFCCARSSIYSLERLPTAMEIEEKSRPYTCFDFYTCRCC